MEHLYIGLLSCVRTQKRFDGGCGSISQTGKGVWPGSLVVFIRGREGGLNLLQNLINFLIVHAGILTVLWTDNPVAVCNWTSCWTISGLCLRSLYSVSVFRLCIWDWSLVSVFEQSLVFSLSIQSLSSISVFGLCLRYWYLVSLFGLCLLPLMFSSLFLIKVSGN